MTFDPESNQMQSYNTSSQSLFLVLQEYVFSFVITCSCKEILSILCCKVWEKFTKNSIFAASLLGSHTTWPPKNSCGLISPPILCACRVLKKSETCVKISCWSHTEWPIPNPAEIAVCSLYIYIYHHMFTLVLRK